MATKAFDIMDVLKSSWENFKKAPFLLIGLLFLSVVVSLLTNLLVSFIPSIIMVIILSIISWMAGSYIMLSFIRASLILANGEIPSWDVLKNDKNIYFKFFGASILLSLILVFATFLFVIPMVLATAIFFPVVYIVVDKKNIGIIDAFKRSWEIATPQFVSCIIFIILMFILSIIGMIPLGLGLLIVVPIMYISGAIIYKKLDAAADSDTVEAPVETITSEN
ncbi:MAG: hypothetical protein LBL00_06755 [Endomicrobium sp.]|jgi:hypothetical protein|nr:hypothetical protein [Endomicrobium sp.]